MTQFSQRQFECLADLQTTWVYCRRSIEERRSAASCQTIRHATAEDRCKAITGARAIENVLKVVCAQLISGSLGPERIHGSDIIRFERVGGGFGAPVRRAAI